jgi:5,10-methylenetetrahydrofolate reductase
MTFEAIDRPELSQNRHLLCIEVNPPRGTEIESTFEKLEGQLDGIDLLNVTDSALARMRFAPLPFASMLKSRLGIETVVNLSCRDRNLIAMQGDLLAGWAMGVRSVVALTGDAVTIGDSPERKGVFEVNSIGLLNVIQTLNTGKDMAGNQLKGAPNFFPGVVVNPNVKNFSVELKRLAKKRSAGGRYALSQPVFDLSHTLEFLKQAESVGMPIFLGLLPVRSKESLRNMSKIPGIKVPEELISRVEGLPEAQIEDFSIQACLELVKAAAPHVRGFHVISGTTPKLALRFAQILRSYAKELTATPRATVFQ